MKYYPIHMHLHCSHEASASLNSHMSIAKSLGIEYIWTTEHDTRIGKPKGKYFSFSFPEKSLYTVLPDGVRAGFQDREENTGEYEFKENENGIALCVRAEKGEREALLFGSSGKKHSDPLFSRVTVELDSDIEIKEEGQACVEFILSAQPPTYKQARLCYVLGEFPQKKDDEPTQYLPFPKKQNGKYMFKLLEDVSEDIGGSDNALCNVNLIVKNGAEIVFRTFDFYRELEYEKTRQAQIRLAEERGRKWGVKAFVGFEVTGAGNHKNCFSTKIPVIEYAAYDYKVSNEQAVEYLQRHGATYSWNHPFTEYVKSGKDKEEIFETVVKRLIDNNVYGARLIEVGFPVGRDNFTAKDYLRLWDRLSESGIIITGYGDSDNHHAVSDGWTSGNNFCSFAGLDDDDEPTEENFIKAFRRGSLWSGNPVVMGRLSFSANGKQQGSLIRGRDVCVEFAATDMKCDGYAVCITNGKEVKRLSLKNGCVSWKWVLSCRNKYNFARVELYNDENVLVAFSNPIYLVGEDTKVEKR